MLTFGGGWQVQLLTVVGQTLPDGAPLSACPMRQPLLRSCQWESTG